MNILGCQLDSAWEDKRTNYARVDAMLEARRPEAGSMVVLPEMFATGFSMNTAGVGEKPGGATASYLAGVARRWGVFVAGGLVTLAGSGRGRNQSLLLDPQGQELACYTKIQPFTLGGESDHYEAGSQVTVVPVGGWKVALFICYDLRFPEVFRVATRRGAEVIVVVASWPDKRIGHWTTLLQARAIENQAYVVGVNRCGKDPSLNYNGQSLIVAPTGEVLAAGGTEQGWVEATLNRETFESFRSGLPFLKDMRSDYGAL